MAKQKKLTKAGARESVVGVIRWMFKRLELKFRDGDPLTDDLRDEIVILTSLVREDVDALPDTQKQAFEHGKIDALQLDWLIQHVQPVLRKAE